MIYMPGPSIKMAVNNPVTKVSELINRKNFMILAFLYNKIKNIGKINYGK